jgi:hypothetical protein
MDALQISSAIESRCDIFFTNDKQLRQEKNPLYDNGRFEITNISHKKDGIYQIILTMIQVGTITTSQIFYTDLT